jgi:hypothetical protein
MASGMSSRLRGVDERRSCLFHGTTPVAFDHPGVKLTLKLIELKDESAK